MLRAACLLFFFSGASSLIFEVVWVKLLTVQFGSSAWSISTVVASFMAGLALGSAWAGRRADRIAHPFRVYAALELGIGLFGLLSISILGQLDRMIAPIYTALLGQFGLFVLVRFLISFSVLLVPTFLMGASLPVLVAGLTRSESVRQRVGLLYGVNTLGAAFGVAAAGFYLLPRLGLSGSTLAAAVASGLVALGAMLCHRVLKPVLSVEQAATPEAPAGAVPRDLLAVLVLSGCVSIGWEIACVRLLAPILGSSTYAFSIILTTFLIGIGLGGLLSASPLAPREAYRAGLGWLLTLCALGMLGGLFYANQLPEWMVVLARSSGRQPGWLFAAQGLLVGAMLLLPACCLGAALPLAIAGWQAETGSVGRAVGGIYAANTLGAIGGSLATGFLLLPYLGASGTIKLCAGLAQLAGCGMLLADPSGPPRRRALRALGGAGLLGMLCLLTPNVDLQALHRGVFRALLSESGKTASQSGDLLYAREGISATVTVYRSPDVTTLKVNGKSDASTGTDLTTQYLLGHLPMFLCKSPRTACVIGYGSGATVRAVAAHSGLERVDVVELEPAVSDASHYFNSINDKVLQDRRVFLHHEDGRAFLRYRPARYDVLISEPSNPWIAGVSALFTREFYQLARARLAAGGIFCQWIQTYELSRETLNGMIRTLAEVFPHVVLFRSTANLLCLAADAPIIGSPERYRQRMADPAVRETLARIRITNPYQLLMRYEGSLPADRRVWLSGRTNTDDNLWLEYRAPIEMYLGVTPQLTALAPPVYLDRLRSAFFAGQSREVVAIGLARALAKLIPSQVKRIEGMAGTFGHGPTQQALNDEAARARRRRRTIGRELQLLREAHKHIRSQPVTAIRLLQKLLAVIPSDGRAYRLLGQAYLFDGQPARAERAFREAIRVQPLDYLSRVQLGRLLYRSNRSRQANLLLAEAVEINPRSVQAWLGRIIYMMLGGGQAAAEKLIDEAEVALGQRSFRELRALIEQAASQAGR